MRRFERMLSSVIGEANSATIAISGARRQFMP
jgi:hypothetical protein